MMRKGRYGQVERSEIHKETKGFRRREERHQEGRGDSDEQKGEVLLLRKKQLLHML